MGAIAAFLPAIVGAIGGGTATALGIGTVASLAIGAGLGALTGEFDGQHNPLMGGLGGLMGSMGGIGIAGGLGAGAAGAAGGFVSDVGAAAGMDGATLGAAAGLTGEGAGALAGVGAGLGSLGAGGLTGAATAADIVSQAMGLTGAATAADAATQLGYGSVDAMVAGISPGAMGSIDALGGAAAGGAAAGSAPNLLGSLITSQSPALGVAGGTSTAGGLFGMGADLYQLYNAYQLQQQAKQLTGTNAMAPYASQYAQQLAALEANPSSITNYPDYQSGLQAVQRSMAAQGYAGSGNMAQALAKYGSSFFNEQVQQLAQLAGMGTTTSAAGLAAQAAGNNQSAEALAQIGSQIRQSGLF